MLADVACMLRYTRDDLTKARVGWLGCTNGTLFSLIEALRYFPFSLQVALPPLEDRPTLETYARHCGVKVDFVDTPQQAVEGCNFVYAGCRSGLDDELAQQWKVDDALLSHADQKARVLLGTSPMQAIEVASDILASPASLLLLQSENRLRVHKRLLHWVFLENERVI